MCLANTLAPFLYIDYVLRIYVDNIFEKGLTIKSRQTAPRWISYRPRLCRWLSLNCRLKDAEDLIYL